MNLRSIGLGLALASLTAATGWAQSDSPAVVLQPSRPIGATVAITLRAADAATLSQTLGEALGGTVRMEGAATAPVTLDLDGASARGALDAVASALHGSWRPVYAVTAGAAAAGAIRPRPLGRTVTASLVNVSARAAFALVARAGGGTLELPVDLTRSVTLVAKEMPVEQAFDELARQAEANWTVTYVIRAGVAPPFALPRTGGLRAAPTSPRFPILPQGQLDTVLTAPGARPNNQRSFPIPFAGTAKSSPATDPNAGRLLGEGLARVMQMPPAQRRYAVRDFAAQLDQQFRQMQALPAAQRAKQIAAMRPVYQAASRTAEGLTPDQRREFQPILDVFKRWMR